MNSYHENNRRFAFCFSIVGSLVIIAFVFMTNYLTSWSSPWFIYPSFAVIWWPLSVLFLKQSTSKLYSVIGALVTLTFFTADYYLNIPSYPWLVFTIYPILLWPACVFLGRKVLNPMVALGLSSVGILYYILLNLKISSGFPWAIFPAYVLLWWPLCAAYGRSGRHIQLSVYGTLLSTIFFITLNVITSPHTIWAVYIIFALAWWPLATYFIHMRNKGYENSRF